MTTLTTTPGQTRQRVAAAPLPPAGPAWFSAVMGTGILATLLQLHVGATRGGHWAAVLLLFLGWLLLLGLGSAFAARVVRDRAALTETMAPSVVGLWGTVSMGLLAIGAATLAIAPDALPHLAHAAVVVDAGLWTTGTALGLLTALGFTAALATREMGLPSPTWGLPIVPPMVSATTGASLVPHLSSTLGRLALLVVAAGCFVLALSLGTVVFTIAYRHHVAVAQIPLVASASSWIPLGIVGQSTAAAQAMAAQTSGALSVDGQAAAHQLADAYGYLMLVVGIPVVAFAVLVTARGFRAGMPFSPGWWALTFPIGTLALGAHLLGAATGHRPITLVGWLAVGALCCTWTLCATASLVALRRQDPRRGTQKPAGSWGR